MENQPEVVRLRVPSEEGEAREVSAWRVGPGLYLTATTHLLGPRHQAVRRIVVQAPGQAPRALAVESDDESNLTLLAPEVEVQAPGSESLTVEVLGSPEGTEAEWSLLEDAPEEVSNCTVLLSPAQGGQRVLGRLSPKGDVLEVTTSPDSGVEVGALLGCPVLQGGGVVGLVTQRTREEGTVLAVTASTLLSLWRRRYGAGQQGWKQRSFAYGTIQLFLAAIADSERWKRELARVDPRLAPGFGAYELTAAQARQSSMVLFLLQCLAGPLVTLLLFDMALAGLFQRQPGLFTADGLARMSQQLVMTYCITLVGALGLSLLTGVGAAAGAATLGGLAGSVAALLALPLTETAWMVGGITAGTMCGTACGVLWMQRVEARFTPTREQLLAVTWALLEGVVLFILLSLLGLEFSDSRLSWGMERERVMGAVIGLLLVSPCVVAFFLRRREAPGEWFGTVLLGMVAVFTSLGAVLHPILATPQPHQSAVYAACVGVLAGVALCGTFSMMHALAEDFGAGPWSDAAPVLGCCLLLPLVFLAFAGPAGEELVSLAWSLLASGLLSFVLMILRRWVPIRARYVGAGQHESGTTRGVSEDSRPRGTLGS